MIQYQVKCVGGDEDREKYDAIGFDSFLDIVEGSQTNVKVTRRDSDLVKLLSILVYPFLESSLTTNAHP